MKSLRVLLAILLSVLPVAAQTKAPIPFIKNQWFTSTGVVAAGYKLCTYAAGTTTPATTYSTSTGTSNTNPVTLDTAGRANVFLDASAYKFILYAPGTGNTCNGANVGTAIWTEDNIAGYATTYIPASPLALAYGGTANTTGVRSDFIFGATGNPTCSAGGGTNNWLHAGGGPVAATQALGTIYFASTASTASNLQIIINGGVVPASESAVFTIQKNSADTGLTCTIAAGGQRCSDTSHSISIIATDGLNLKLNCSGGATVLNGPISATIRLSQ